MTTLQPDCASRAPGYITWPWPAMGGSAWRAGRLSGLSNLCSSLGRWRRSRPAAFRWPGWLAAPSAICCAGNGTSAMARGGPGSPGSSRPSDRAVHKIVCVPARSLTPLETPGACRRYPVRSSATMGGSGRGLTASTRPTVRPQPNGAAGPGQVAPAWTALFSRVCLPRPDPAPHGGLGAPGRGGSTQTRA
jgi:hypothetical protein